MIVLSVESSCDETSVSINRDGINILSNVVVSQIDVHKQYGGVVPEIASREHIKGITIVFEEAISDAGIKKEDIDFIAINSNRFLPEKNRPNNWKYLKSSSGLKPVGSSFATGASFTGLMVIEIVSLATLNAVSRPVSVVSP